ncbi:hypothetical protein Mapa_002497 [Marchantia paleacea]|nr:hypothetical protein Mapa_002497 [Marchantia paleacea]
MATSPMSPILLYDSSRFCRRERFPDCRASASIMAPAPSMRHLYKFSFLKLDKLPVSMARAIWGIASSSTRFCDKLRISRPGNGRCWKARPSVAISLSSINLKSRSSSDTESSFSKIRASSTRASLIVCLPAVRTPSITGMTTLGGGLPIIRACSYAMLSGRGNESSSSAREANTIHRKEPRAGRSRHRAIVCETSRR